MTSLAIANELQLPWESSTEEDRRFHKMLCYLSGIFLVLAIVIPILPLETLTTDKAVDTPPEWARVILEKKVLPEPVPEPVKPRAVAKKEPVKPRPVEKPRQKPKPEPVNTLAVARETAAVSGLLAFQDDLQAMRDTVDVSSLDQTQTSRGETSAAKVQRSIITRSARSDSGGIETSALSTDTGGAALAGRETTTVKSSIASTARKKSSESRSVQLGGRSDESIRRVMDENKGAIFSIYNRALRKDPLLEGRLVFEMVIDAAGKVEELKLLSSELADEALTRKILSRINLIRFGEEQVISTRVNYSFDFLPYT